MAYCCQIFREVLCDKKEIFLFLQEISIEKDNDFKSLFEDVEFLCELTFITDLTNYLNILNFKLQETNQTISQFFSHIDSFRRKLSFKNQKKIIFIFILLVRYFSKNTAQIAISKNL